MKLISTGRQPSKGKKYEDERKTWIGSSRRGSVHRQYRSRLKTWQVHLPHIAYRCRSDEILYLAVGPF